MAAPVPAAALVGEFVGTFMLVFAVGCNVITGSASWAVTSIAMTLMVAIYSLGAVSGANFNPAVSLALALNNSDEFDWGRAVKYMVAQIAGGIAAALAYGGLFWDVFNLAPAAGFSILQADLRSSSTHSSWSLWCLTRREHQEQPKQSKHW